MRELTKSTLSAGLAMSLFGLQTMVNAFRRRPADGGNSAQGAIDSVTQSMLDQTGTALRETFHAGDKVQRELVDLTFRAMTLAPILSRTDGTATLSDATRQASERIRNWIGDPAGPRKGGCGCSGSAPAPPTRPAAPAEQPQPQPSAPMGEGWGPVPD